MQHRKKIVGLCMFLVLLGGLVATFIVAQRIPAPAHAAGTVIFSDNFDSYAPGPLPTGQGANQWTSVNVKGTGSGVAVSDSFSNSPSNSLQISLGSVRNSFAYAEKDYTGPGYVEHTLDFELYLPIGFSLGNQTISLFTVENLSQPQNGSAAVWLTSSLQLQVVRYDSLSNKHATGAQQKLNQGQWYAIELNQVNDPQNGSYSLLIDGTQVLGETGIDTGNALVTTILAGEKQDTNAPLNTSFYEDDVVTSTTTPPPPTVIFTDNFDSYSPGPLPTGPGANQWTKVGVKGAGFGVAVSSTQYYSQFNSLQISLGSVARGHAWAEKDYGGAGYLTHAAQFKFYLGSSNFTLGNQPIALFTVENSSNPKDGSTAVWLTPNFHLQVVYYDSLGKSHAKGTQLKINTAQWYTVEIDQTNDPMNGSYTLYLDGNQIGGATGIDLGDIPVNTIFAGDRLISRAGLMGQFYEDDVETATGFIGIG